MAAQFSEAETAEFRKHFEALDIDGNGRITKTELASILQQLNMYESEEQCVNLIAEVDLDKSGAIEFVEFLAILDKIKHGKAKNSNFAKVAEASKKLIQVQGKVGVHSFSQEEMSAFATHLSNCFKEDADLKYLMPIDPTGDDLCKKVGDGVLLAKFINLAVRDTIDERALNKPKGAKGLTLFQVNENQNLLISAAKSIGVSTVNIGAAELIDGQHHPHLVLGLVWQLVKIQLLNSINLKNHPELVRLLEPGEELADLLKLPPEQLLLRWFNYHLKNAHHDKRVTNFGPDVQDSTAYTVLLHQIAPQTCDKSALQIGQPDQRAQRVLDNARKLGVQTFIRPQDIVAGNKRLNLAFTAAIFNQCPGLDPLTKEEYDKCGLDEEDKEGSREERAFRMWINSLGIEDTHVVNLYEDCKDGLVLLRVMDRVHPGCVRWANVEKNPNNKFKKVANCNYAVVVGKDLKFSLVGIGGVDIVNGNKKLVLALVWQLMRYHTIRFLAEVQQKRFGNKQVTDDDIVTWANEAVAAKGRSTRMASFKDPSLATSIFFFDLLFSVEQRIIDWDLVNAGETEENRILNARYAISVARKLGCTIFLIPEDIVEVKPKMIMTFVASIMGVAK